MRPRPLHRLLAARESASFATLFRSCSKLLYKANMIRSGILIGKRKVLVLTELNEKMVTMELVMAKDAQGDEEF